jgi:transmembrane sensor
MKTDPTETGGLTRLEQEALEHVQQLMSGSATREALEAAKRWRSLSPAHAEAILLARRLWTRLGPVGREMLERNERPFSSDLNRSRRLHLSRRALLSGTAAAAGAAAYAVVRPPFDLWPSLAELRASYRTATGEQRQIALTGGLSIVLNTQTSISVHSEDDERNRIELISGEAFVSTIGNSRLDHIVRAGDGRMIFGDASLNVRYDGRAVCGVTCLRGSVQVERRGDAVELRTGQYVSYADKGLGSSGPGDAELATAWQKGLLVFHRMPLSEVIAEINRYRHGKIILLNAELGRRTVNARFTIDGVDDIMTLARRELGATVMPLPGGVVLLT